MGRIIRTNAVTYYQNYQLITQVIKIMFLGSKVRLVRRADNLTAIYEPIV
jgi:hypothetical protein